ncbi:MAG: hemerythrin domain-containing protein [Bacteroidales bacterium]|nr:hemerythrin domain-containing protein [Bacteroidales bacterium]
MSNNPIEQLVDDHRYILMVVDYLKAISADITDVQKPLDQGLLRQTVSFLREFADICHHGKEEDLLFPALVEANVPESGCPIGGLKGEHNKGRALVSQLEEGLDKVAGDEQRGRELIAGAVAGLVALYPDHIWREDAMVFPMALNLLDAASLERLERGFAEVEAKHQVCHAHHVAFAEGLRHRLAEAGT